MVAIHPLLLLLLLLLVVVVVVKTTTLLYYINNLHFGTISKTISRYCSTLESAILDTQLLLVVTLAIT